jgi:hypothetical protein
LLEAELGAVIVSCARVEIDQNVPILNALKEVVEGKP